MSCGTKPLLRWLTSKSRYLAWWDWHLAVAVALWAGAQGGEGLEVHCQEQACQQILLPCSWSCPGSMQLELGYPLYASVMCWWKSMKM